MREQCVSQVSTVPKRGLNRVTSGLLAERDKLLYHKRVIHRLLCLAESLRDCKRITRTAMNVHFMVSVNRIPGAVSDDTVQPAIFTENTIRLHSKRKTRDFLI